MTALIPQAAVWAVILVPFFSGVVCFLAGRRAGAWFGLGTAAVLVVLTLKIGAGVFEHKAARYAAGGWGSPLGIELSLDGLSSLMLVLTAFVGAGVSVYASGYFGRGRSSEDVHHNVNAGPFFWPVWLILWGGLNVLFLSADIFNIYVALEIVSFSAVALVALGGTPVSLVSAMRYLFMTILGSLVYLLGVGLLYSAYGVLDLSMLESLVRPGLIPAAAITLMTMGLMIKAALFPMHFWLPPAHANAPAPVSAVLSGLVVMGAFYLLLRFWFGVFFGALVPAAGQVLGGFGAIAILWGALQAFRQARLKLVVAYSTVAQIGYMFLLFPLVTENSAGAAFAWSGGIYVAAAHAFAKAAAFMVAGSVVFALGHDRVDDLRGLAERFPLGTLTFALAGVSLTGLPPSGGFVGKWLLLKGAMLSGQWWYAVLIVAGGLLAAGYIFRVLEVALRSPLPGDVALRVPARMQAAALVMALMALLLGLAAVLPLEMLKINSPLSFTEIRESVL